MARGPVQVEAACESALVELPDGPHSTLEYLLEHLGATPPTPRHRARPPTSTPVTAALRDHHGHRHHTELLPPRDTLELDPDTWPHRRARHRGPFKDGDPPPF